MTGDEYGKLVESIKAHGVREPIVILDDQILDGQHRWRACTALSIECPTVEFDGPSPLAYVMDRNLHRRQLTPSQRAAIAAEALPFYEAEAAERMNKGKKSDPSATLHRGRATENAAAATGASPRLVHDAKTLKENAPALHEEVKAGTKTVTAATREYKTPPPVKKSSPPPSKPKGDPIAQAAIETAPAFEELCTRVHALKREILALAAEPHGASIRAQQIELDCKNVVAAIRFAIPHAPCPKSPKCDEKCLCKGRHWMVREEIERLEK